MQITAEKREKFGKKTKQIRHLNRVPAVVFGKGTESIPISVEYNQFIKVFREAGETSLVDLKFDGYNEKVLVSEVQFHPVSDKVIHVSFHKVDLTEKISADIPVEIVGAEECPVVKSGEGLPLLLLNTVEVEALPADLPSNFEVDISHLTEIDQVITVGELNYDKTKVEITQHEEDEPVVKIDYAEMQEEPEEEVSEEELIAGVEATEETDEKDAESAEKPDSGEDKPSSE